MLAVAQRRWEHGAGEEDTDADAVDAAAHDLELIGYVGLADTARASARPLIEALVEAGRRVVLITGDHPVTARAIARQLGLPADAREMSGAELVAFGEEERAKVAADVQVFARVSPYLKSDMARHHVLPVIGEHRVFGSLHEAVAFVAEERRRLGG